MKILIADDDAISRKMLGRALRQMGYDTVVAEDGMVAWEQFRADDIRLVILDWEMPGMDGIALCRKIREVSKNNYCYIIILTAKSEIGHLKEAFEAGSDDYISKPFDIEEMIMRIKTGERILNLEMEHIQLADILTESRNKLKTILDSLEEEIVLLDDQFAIKSANKPFIVNRDLEFRDIMGVAATDLDDRLFNKEACDAIRSVFHIGKPRNFLLKIRGADGEERIKDIQCLPIGREGEDVSQVVFTATDITEARKKSESVRTLNEELNFALAQIKNKNTMLENALDQLKENESQMLQSEKMASIGQLAAGVAHEINNPTGFVSSNLKTLEDNIHDLLELVVQYQGAIQLVETSGGRDGMRDALTLARDTEKRIDIDFLSQDLPQLIKESREGMDRIKKIVMDLKDFAHPEDEEKKFADINACIESTLNIVWSEIKYKAKLEKRYGEIPLLLCHPRQLNQVFMNLLVNAAQAIREHGTIDVQTEFREGNVKITVADTGCGIPPENLTKIFDPFFTTKPVGMGTGLGLHLVYSIVKKHNGKIDVKSDVGKGTTFIIELPADSKGVAS